MFSRYSAVALLVVAIPILAGGTDVVRAQGAAVERGFDLFVTDPSQTHFLGLPFEGVELPGTIFDFGPPIGLKAVSETDTIVQRLDRASVAATPGTSTVNIRLRALSLRSQFPIDPDGAGPIPPTTLYVTLQENRTAADALPPGPQSLGVMDVSFTDADGGTFDSQFLIYVDMRSNAPDGPIVCDPPWPFPCAALAGGLPLFADDAVWGRIAPADSIRIRDVNRFLAGPGDISEDFWPAVDPDGFRTNCIPHSGHPGGVPINHCTGATSCITEAIVDGSGCDSRDNNCDGNIDDCPEDVTRPEPACPPDQTQECNPPNDVSPAVMGFATATDDCNPVYPTPVPPANISNDDTIIPQCGLTFDVQRVWTAVDECGNGAGCLQQIFVVDTTPPEFEAGDPLFDISLWPPNHGYVVFQTDDLVSVTDVCGDAFVLASGCHSNQPEEVHQGSTDDGGNGDGRFFEDCVVSEDGRQFAVRAERLGGCGPDSDRVYAVAFTATDECGNEATEFGLVRVEHDRSGKPPVQQGRKLGPNDPPPFPYLHPTTYGDGCGGN
jgi:hypothetical protein